MMKQKDNQLIVSLLFGTLFLVVALVGCSSKVDVKVQSRDSYQSFSVAGMEAFLPKGDFRANLSKGKKVFEENCMTCHVNGSKRQEGKIPIALTTIRNRTPMELFKFISGAEKGHPKDFSQSLSIQDRWNAIFYVRSFHSKKPTLAGFDEAFGRNCAICHGKRGYGDGPLAHGLYPPPANFNQVSRLYNRTDQYLFDRISDGAYPTAMPPWKDVEGMKDPEARWRFVDYIRAFSYTKGKE